MMADPFRGEMTARYVQMENLEWAARERLARQARRRAAESGLSRLAAVTYLERIPGWRRVSPARTPRQEAS